MINGIRNHIKWFFQRVTRGWDDREIWSLDNTISKFVLPRLKLLKKNKHGIPCDFVNKDGSVREDEWNRKLDEMIWAHWFIVNQAELPYHRFHDHFGEWERCRAGLGYFGKYYLSLWD